MYVYELLQGTEDDGDVRSLQMKVGDPTRAS